MQSKWKEEEEEKTAKSEQIATIWIICLKDIYNSETFHIFTHWQIQF